MDIKGICQKLRDSLSVTLQRYLLEARDLKGAETLIGSDVETASVFAVIAIGVFSTAQVSKICFLAKILDQGICFDQIDETG